MTTDRSVDDYMNDLHSHLHRAELTRPRRSIDPFSSLDPASLAFDLLLPDRDLSHTLLTTNVTTRERRGEGGREGEGEREGGTFHTHC